MKIFLLVILLVAFILPGLFAEIKNGYEKQVPMLKNSLQGLRDILVNDRDLTARERRNVKRNIKSVIHNLAYYEITQTLLEKFKSIAPDLYHEIDGLKDSNGRTIDVYIKFIDKEQASFDSPGIVSFQKSADDRHRCSSEYGEGTASVKVWIMSTSLLILSHEFGHLRYIVPNLDSYVGFYNRIHGSGRSSGSFGHRCDDPSGKSAFKFEKRFRENYVRFLKSESERPVSPFSLVVQTKRKISQSQEADDLRLAMSGW